MASKDLAQSKLDDRQRALVYHLARGTSLEESARLAGYLTDRLNARYTQEEHKSTIAAIIRTPIFRAALAAEAERVLETEAAPAAIAILRELIANKETGERVRMDSAKIILDRAGFGPRSRNAGAAAAKQMAEMTPAELHAFIEKNAKEIQSLEDELANRATLVSAPIEDNEEEEAKPFLE